MKYIFHSNEKGSTLLISILILLLLTIIGIAATNTSIIEILISGNDKLHKMTFYTAESGWQVAVSWLDNQYPEISGNKGLDNSGGGIDFSSGKYNNPDSFLLANNSRYSVDVKFNGAQSVPGYSTEFKRYTYQIDSTGTGARNSESTISVTAGKIVNVGGY